MSFTSRFRRLLSAGLETKAHIATSDAELLEWLGSPPSAAGIRVTPREALKCAPVRAAVAAISEPLGTLPVHVFKRTADGKVRDASHPVYRLLHDQANDFTPASLFREQLTADALLHKGGFAYIARNGEGQPVSLYRLNPFTDPVTVKDDPFEGPTYEIQRDGKTKVVPRENILHLRSPSLSCMGLVHDASDVIGLALVLERHAARLFANGARPSGVLSLKGNSTADAVIKAGAAWKATQGGEKSGGTAVIPSDASWQSMVMTSVDSQFHDMRSFAIAEIGRFWNISPIFLQSLERATWSNSEQAKEALLSVTLLPWLARWEGEIALKLFGEDERKEFYAEFDTEAFVRADFAAKTEGINKLIAARVMSPNEARSLLNMPGYGPEGDKFENPNTSTAVASNA